MRILIIIFAWLLSGQSVFCQSAIFQQRYPLTNQGKCAYFFPDSSTHASFEEVEKSGRDFRLGKSAIFNGRSSGMVWWMKLSASTGGDHQAFLYINYANIDSIDLYYRDSLMQVRHFPSGMFGTKGDRFISGTGYAFPLYGLKKNSGTVYLRMRASNTLLAPVKILPENTLNNLLLKTDGLQLFYAGIGLALLIFNVFMYLTTRSRLFALYIGRIVLLYYFGMVFYLQGYGLLFDIDIARFIMGHAHCFIAGGYICSILFNNRFLKLRKNMPLMLKFFKWLTGLWALHGLLSLLGNIPLTNVITQCLSFSTSVLIFYSSLKVIAKKDSRLPNVMNRLYVIGWLPVALVSVYVMLCLQDVLTFQSYTLNVLSLAGMIEGILISLGLFGQRLRLLSRHNAHFRKQEIELRMQMEGYRNQLEVKVEKHFYTLSELTAMARKADPAFFSIFLENEQHFIQSLRTIAPTLVNSELELSALLRLNLSTKEIAMAYRQSVRGVESRKYRLRKKLGLDSETNLQLWLMNLAETS
ncbi:7TM diverse intracellular signaling domain-containing protein [Pedobacter aquatilis]|uniref:7TM diverse intracellular signaling domain-containing protein n=1 Tax=Pedobacter aquatilis TaxID=351343 RepID=UPI00292D1D3B|nr:7TM diverse intracellular signaling domain-containing protein [Pedobacter aquatilis]